MEADSRTSKWEACYFAQLYQRRAHGKLLRHEQEFRDSLERSKWVPGKEAWRIRSFLLPVRWWAHWNRFADQRSQEGTQPPEEGIWSYQWPRVQTKRRHGCYDVSRRRKNRVRKEAVSSRQTSWVLDGWRRKVNGCFRPQRLWDWSDWLQVESQKRLGHCPSRNDCA